MQLPEGLSRESLCHDLAEAKIPVRVYYSLPLHDQPVLRHAGCWHSATPVADRLARTVLSLPMGPYLTEKDQHRVVAVVAEALERRAA